MCNTTHEHVLTRLCITIYCYGARRIVKVEFGYVLVVNVFEHLQPASFWTNHKSIITGSKTIGICFVIRRTDYIFKRASRFVILVYRPTADTILRTP